MVRTLISAGHPSPAAVPQQADGASSELENLGCVVAHRLEHTAELSLSLRILFRPLWTTDSLVHWRWACVFSEHEVMVKALGRCALAGLVHWRRAPGALNAWNDGIIGFKALLASAACKRSCLVGGSRGHECKGITRES